MLYRSKALICFALFVTVQAPAEAMMQKGLVTSPFETPADSAITHPNRAQIYHNRQRLGAQSFESRGLLHRVSDTRGTAKQEFIDKKYIVIRDVDGNEASIDGAEAKTISTAIDNRNNENALNSFYQATALSKKSENKRIDLKVKIKESGEVLGSNSQNNETSTHNSSATRDVNTARTMPENIPSRSEPVANRPQAPDAPQNRTDDQNGNTQVSRQAAINMGAGYVDDGFHGELAPGFEDNQKAASQSDSTTTAINPENKFHKAFKKYDRDDNQIVSMREFSVYQLNMFNRFDKNGDGEISVNEIRRAFKKNPAKGAALLKQIDKNRNKTIERIEFRTEIIKRFRRYDTNKNGVVEIGAG